jgi:hypothetical protein
MSWQFSIEFGPIDPDFHGAIIRTDSVNNNRNFLVQNTPLVVDCLTGRVIREAMRP